MAAFQQDRHAVTRLHAKPQQMPRQTVGPGVEFGITQGNAVVDCGASFRVVTDLCFEQAMHGLLVRVIQRGVIEPDQ